MSIPLNQIGTLLSLGSGPELLVNVILYIIFFLALFTMFLIPNKNMVATLLMGAVILSAIIIKLSLAAPHARIASIMPSGSFGLFVLNAIMATMPFITVGVTRKARASQSVRSNLPAILCGLVGIVNFFLYGLLFEQWFHL